MYAIILSRKDFREHDQRISLYTKEAGKKEALARGVKKITSKNSGSLEPFSLVEVEIIPGKEIEYIGSVQIVELFKNIRGDLVKITTAQMAMALVNTLFSSSEPDASSFDMIVSWLQSLDKAASVSPIVLDALVLKLLAELGFAPQLDACVQCGNSQGAQFDITAGGIICSKCLTKYLQNNQIVPLTPSILSALRRALDQGWQAIFPLKLDNKELPQFHNLVYQFAIFHSGKKLKDWVFSMVDKPYP